MDSTPEQLFNDNQKLASFWAGKFVVFGHGADDLRQEALIALSKAAETYHTGGASFSTWASSIIKNRLVNLYHSAKRRQQLLAAEEVQPWHWVDSNNKDRERAIRDFPEAVKLLPAEERTAICLYAEGLTYREIAEQCDVSTQTAVNRVKAAGQSVLQAIQ